MSKLLLLGSWHAGANCTQYADALRNLGHEVETLGPRFTQEDADRWRMDLMEMEWPPTSQEADEYVAKVLRESPKPDIQIGKGEDCLFKNIARVNDALISFWQYGETPTVAWEDGFETEIPSAVVYGDTHTGRLQEQIKDSRRFNHVFVQFRRADMKAFGETQVHWLPAAANPTIWRPMPEVERDLECVFVGSTHPHVHRDRVALIRYLQDNGINVTVKHAFGSDAARLMARAKVVLNKSLAGDLNMRTMEALACGACLVTDHVDGITDLFSKTYEHATVALAPYVSKEGALGVIQELLTERGGDGYREAMGASGCARVVAEHTYEHRARQLLQTMGLPEEGDGPKFSHDTRTDPRMVGSGDSVIHASGDISSGGIVESTVGTRETDAERWRPVQSVATVTGREDRGRDERVGSLRGNAGEEKLGEEGDAVKSGEPNVVRLGLVSHGTAWLGSARFGEGSSSKEERNGPVVSVVIPCFNHFDDCTAPLLALLDKQRLQAEIILVDDGSTDTTTNAEGTGDAFRIIHKSNGGFCSAVNAGVKEARGEFVCVLNNDTTPQEGWLAPLLDELKYGAGIVGSLILNPDGTVQAAGLEQESDGTWHNNTTLPLPPHPLMGDVIAMPVPSIQGACFAMRRDTFLRLGGLDEVWGNGGCCEVDLSLRVAKEGLPVRLRLDSKVRHAEGSTRFHVPGIQEKIAENQRRLIERWGMPDVRNGNADSGRGRDYGSGNSDRVSDRGSYGGVERSGAGTLASHGRPLVVAWQGHFNAEQGGSLALINAVLKKELPKHGVIVHDYFAPGYIDIVLDVTRSERDGLPRMLVSHYFTPDGWEEPPANIEHWAAVAPWEYPPSITDFPDGWKRVAQNKRLEEIWTPSEYARGLLSPLFGAERVKVIPNGVDLDLFNPDGEKAPGRPDLWRCLFVGGMIWRKGLDRLYDAWRLAFPPEEGAPAVLVIKAQGRTTFYQGQTIEPPADLIRPQNVYPTISVIDRDMEATELAEIYRKVDCVASAFRFEGWNLPLLEGMASGKPLVFSGHPPAIEFVPEGAGIAVPSVNHEVDVVSFARALRWLYEHREDGVAMGAEGRKAAMAYSWPSVAEKYAEAIRRVCDGN